MKTAAELPHFQHYMGKVFDSTHNCDICKEEAMRYALVLKTDGTTEVVELPEDVSKQVDILGEKVGGLFDTVNIYNEDHEDIEFTLWVNDEGLLLDLPYNKAASELLAIEYHRQGMSEDEARSLAHLVGDAVMTYGPDEEGNTEGFDRETIDDLIDLLKKMRVIKKG